MRMRIGVASPGTPAGRLLAPTASSGARARKGSAARKSIRRLFQRHSNIRRESNGAPGLWITPDPDRGRATESVQSVTPMISIRTIDTTEGFAALAPAWEALHGEAPSTSIFTSWLWQREWWRVYGEDRPLRILVATEGGATVGILPLYIQTSKVAGFPVRYLRPVGTGGDTYPDDLGPVLGGRSPGEVGRALAQAALRLDGWDIL